MRPLAFGLVFSLLLLSISSLSYAAKGTGNKEKNLELDLPEIVNETAGAESSAKDTEKGKDEDKSKEKESVSSSSSSAEKEKESTITSLSEETTAVAPSKPSYFMRIQNLLRRVLEAFGLVHQKRKSKKMMYPEDNVDNLQYVREMRTTVGALMGKKECWKRAACDAGSYLRSLKGKEVLIVLMEKLAPASWVESVNQIKEAVIYKDPCEYKCLDD